jgi:hypothetical protein
MIHDRWNCFDYALVNHACQLGRSDGYVHPSPRDSELLREC